MAGALRLSDLARASVCPHGLQEDAVTMASEKQQPAQAQAVGPPRIYYYGLLDQKAKEQAVKEVAKLLRERFEVQYKALREAMGLRTPPPAERLREYAARTPEAWAQYRAQRPDLFKQQRDDFARLAKARLVSQAVRGLDVTRLLSEVLPPEA